MASTGGVDLFLRNFIQIVTAMPPIKSSPTVVAHTAIPTAAPVLNPAEELPGDDVEDDTDDDKVFKFEEEELDVVVPPELDASPPPLHFVMTLPLLSPSSLVSFWVADSLPER